MLTKSSIKFQIKNGNILPKLQSMKTIMKNGLADLFELYAESKETSKTKLENQAGTMIRSKYLKDGALSILNRASEFKEPVSIESEIRLQMIESAQKLRTENEWDSFEEFQKTFEDGSNFEKQLCSDIYGDLTTDLHKNDFSLKSKDEFIAFYNLAMHQGLLIYADHINIKVYSKKFLLKEVFRKIRFHEIRCHIKTHNDQSTHIDIDCKQSGKIAAYRANKKLSHLLKSLWKIPHWELESKISISRDQAGLKLDLKAPLKDLDQIDKLQEESELTTQLKKEFKQKTEEALSPICLGHQNWIFPDTQITQGNQIVYVAELDEHQLKKFITAQQSQLGDNIKLVAVLSKKTIEKASKRKAEPITDMALSSYNAYIFNRQINYKSLITHIKSKYFSS